MLPTDDDVARMRASLRVGELSDTEFDRLLTARARKGASHFWTPIAVAQRAAEVLDGLGARHVLDVGAGPGKFCLAAAATRPHISFVGVERRAALVALATSLAARLAIPNARFEHGDALTHGFAGFDAVYFFNPFSENLVSGVGRFDQTVSLSPARFVYEMRRVDVALKKLTPGTIVLTYHGLGAPIPRSYTLAYRDDTGSDHLHAWVQTRAAHDGWYHVESIDGPYQVSGAAISAAVAAWRTKLKAEDRAAGHRHALAELMHRKDDVPRP